ncbi:DUF262 domain-containing protein [Leuconostoc mesenteroides]|uniref:DUF262 domain-containing protein n=1 Tax=Leuconostoc mesenteroides TaxID=1245 RepID=UPI001C1F7EC9|nr:DUF262 domain-containing protein [Leuconostoc mesenteroides]MBU7546855.1 DUF262 domain-containing protein [Leuconostoc mesenteroides]
MSNFEKDNIVSGLNDEETQTFDPILSDEDENASEDGIASRDLFSITSYGADLSLRELHSMIQEKDLIKPSIQRNYVWQLPIASRFMETILLGLPVPSIFLSLNQDSTYWIVDGLQRLTTISNFINGLTDQNKIFKLSNNINPLWAGKTFSQLSPADQRKIKTSTIHAIIFKQDAPKDDDTSLFQIFERINTGGVRLSSQEIRNSIYHNEINETLIDLSKMKEWTSIISGHSLEKRMRDVEYILRFFLIYSIKDIATSDIISLKTEMNLFMDTTKTKYDNSEENVHILKDLFVQSIKYLSKYDNPFSDNKAWFDNIMFDSILVSFAKKISKDGMIPELDADTFEEKKQELLNDQEFIEATQNTRRTRYDLIQKRHLITDRVFFGD